jgi:hypothetical protein
MVPPSGPNSLYNMHMINCQARAHILLLLLRLFIKAKKGAPTFLYFYIQERTTFDIWGIRDKV